MSATDLQPPPAPAPIEPEADLHHASHSSLVAHRHCPQKWFYGHVKKYQRAVEEGSDAAVERDFGSWWHMLRAADSIMRGRHHDSLKWVPLELRSVDGGPTFPTRTVTPVDVLLLAKSWYDGLPRATRDEWPNRIGEPLAPRLRGLYARWQDQWAEAIRSERPLAVELRWERRLPPVLGPGGVLVDARTVLVGYVDEVYADLRRNVVVARDHKVSRSLGTQSSADDMMDSQLQLYAWGASPTVTAWGAGRLAATAYDRARMVRPRTPVVTQMGSLSKTVTDYDLATYRAWCATGPRFPGRTKDGSQAGTYREEPEVVERLSTEAARSTWFQRTLTPLNTHLIKAHLRAAVDSSIDMTASRERALVSGEAARNLSYACRWCDFVGLCRAQMVGGADGEYVLSDYNLTQREREQ